MGAPRGRRPPPNPRPWILDPKVKTPKPQVRAQRQTPVWFGSGYNNFGVETFLNKFIEISQPPSPHVGGEKGEITVNPDDKEFTGFVFKLQANMDPKHRDRIAFVRVCSGRFDKDMQVHECHRARGLGLGVWDFSPPRAPGLT